MDTPTERNRLEDEASPYLRSHADNPVNWQPWDELALEAARERDVPIFLSIGYSACHWCHVMAEESFEDREIASQINESFVPIKVDREEQPAIDSIYMTVCRIVNRAGCGWPLSVWLTPDGLPFYVGTYFPPEESRGQPGFTDVLADIAEQWETNRDELRNRGQQWMQAAKGELESTPEPRDNIDSGFTSDAAEALVSRADREFGGFGGGQKFPQPGRLQLLAEAATRGETMSAEPVLTETLDAMADGGLRDHLGGGFHRYCVDREWIVPHFEKMLYDNAEIPRAYLAGYQLTGRERYAEIAHETYQFVARELTHPDGAFYSTLDARSPSPENQGSQNQESTHDRGVEGAFYVWTPEGVTAAMEEYTRQGEGDTDQPLEEPGPTLLARLVSDRYGITESGNFEGRTVPTITASIPDLADEYQRDAAEIRELLAIAEDRLRNARAERPRPPRDEKIIAGWNGLMIGSLAEARLVLGEPRYAARAKEALEMIRDTLWDGETLARRYKEPRSEEPSGTKVSRVKGDGVLEDYAFLARGALRVYQALGAIEALSFSLSLTRAMVREFWDEEQETLYYASGADETLPARPQDVADQSTPSSMGVAVEVLFHLDAFAPEEGFADIGEAVLRTHGSTIEAAPMQHPSLVMAMELHRQGHLEVTTAADGYPESWLDFLGSRYDPHLLLAPRPLDEETMDSWVAELELADTPPIWAGRTARDGPTAYVCRNACSPPLDTREQIEEWVDEFE